MDHPPPFPGGGQPKSYTSGLLPDSGEQSSPVSDFTTEMDSFLTLPSSAQEDAQSFAETGSLRQAPVEAPKPPPHQAQQQQTMIHYNLDPHSSSNTSAPMTTTAHSQDQYHRYHPRSTQRQMLYTPPPRDDFDHYSYGESPTCGSGTSNNSNFSPASPAVTWPSPATSFQHPADHLTHEGWGGIRTSTPVSMNSCVSPSGGEYPEPLDARNEWHVEPFRTHTTIADIDALDAVSCPASPASLAPPAYMMHHHVSQASPYDMELLSARASEPPMEPKAPAAASNKTETPYAQLIYRALKNAVGHSMSLQDLYAWFQENTDKCKPGQRGWMNSIRHNLSMNAGFTKVDRKRQNESSTPDADGVEQNSDPKRSTEWTLTQEAIENGIQSTTRYRNKKSDKDKDRSYYVNDAHGFRHGIAANRLASTRSAYPYRVNKVYRDYPVRHGPTSGHFARTCSPQGQWSPYGDALISHATSQASSQGQNIKTEPDVATLQVSTGVDHYGLIMQDPQMMHNGIPFDMSTSGVYSMAAPSQPTGPFPYGTSDVHLGYSGTGNDPPLPADISQAFWSGPGGGQGF